MCQSDSQRQNRRQLTAKGQISAFSRILKSSRVVRNDLPNFFFFSSLQIILLTFNQQKLSRFECFARREFFFSHLTFVEVNCMPSKLNYSIHKEQRTVYQNHSHRYLEVLKDDCNNILNSVKLFVLICTRGSQTILKYHKWYLC